MKEAGGSPACRGLRTAGCGLRAGGSHGPHSEKGSSFIMCGVIGGCEAALISYLLFIVSTRCVPNSGRGASPFFIRRGSCSRVFCLNLPTSLCGASAGSCAATVVVDHSTYTYYRLFNCFLF